MRLRPGTWRLRVSWWTHVGVALAFGLFSSGLAALVALTLVINAGTVPACEAATPAPPDFEAAPFAFDPEERALTFGQALVDQDYRSAYAMLAPELLPYASLCEVRLENVQTLADNGLARVEVVTTQGWPSHPERSTHGDIPPAPVFGFVPTYDELEVLIRLVPDQSSADSATYVQLVLLRDGRISRVELRRTLTELGPVEDFAPPPYADSTAFEETEVVIGHAPWELGGTLTVPRGPGAFPAVVLVPGSGYDGRDAISGATKAFRDLAWGLASRGVAVLRYDKRTLTHALAVARQPDFTIDAELVDDALAAVELLRQMPRIDPARVFVLGASLGGVAAPRIAQRNPEIAGLIFYSAPSGRYWDGFVASLQRRFEEDGTVTQGEQRALDLMRTYVAAVGALVDGETPPRNLTVRTAYHADFGGYRPEDVARDLPLPLLILQGTNDDVVSADDFLGWIEELHVRDDAAFRLYEGHNHTLLDGRGVDPPYHRARLHVGAEVITDIAAWLLGGWPERPCADGQDLNAGCRGGPTAFRGSYLNP
ncbi:MAG: alpha/beta hydrolase [Chloroflexi bacterium]|nr:alpha/beta hydrolase [Chloroflexota bacterium]